MKIVSRGFTEGYYYKPRVDMEILKEFHEGIIALSACLAGEVQKNIVRGMYEEGKAAALRYQDCLLYTSSAGSCLLLFSLSSGLNFWR